MQERPLAAYEWVINKRTDQWHNRHPCAVSINGIARDKRPYCRVLIRRVRRRPKRARGHCRDGLILLI